MNPAGNRKKKTGTRAAHTKERANFWRVSIRTMQAWKAARPPAPVDDAEEMIRWYAAMPSASQAKLTPEFARRVTELRIQIERTNGKHLVLDADYAAFEKEYRANDPSKDTDNISGLKRQRDFALYKINLAQARNDFPAVQDATRLLTHYSSIIHDEELRAQKLNKAIGDVLPRSDHEAIISAQAFWTMRAIDACLDSVTRRLLNLSFPEEARAILEPALLSARFFDPLVFSARSAARNALPQWLVDRYTEVIDDYLENGRALVLAELAADPFSPETEGSGI